MDKHFLQLIKAVSHPFSYHAYTRDYDSNTISYNSFENNDFWSARRTNAARYANEAAAINTSGIGIDKPIFYNTSDFLNQASVVHSIENQSTIEKYLDSLSNQTPLDIITLDTETLGDRFSTDPNAFAITEIGIGQHNYGSNASPTAMSYALGITEGQEKYFNNVIKRYSQTGYRNLNDTEKSVIDRLNKYSGSFNERFRQENNLYQVKSLYAGPPTVKSVTEGLTNLSTLFRQQTIIQGIDPRQAILEQASVQLLKNNSVLMGANLNFDIDALKRVYTNLGISPDVLDILQSRSIDTVYAARTAAAISGQSTEQYTTRLFGHRSGFAVDQLMKPFGIKGRHIHQADTDIQDERELAASLFRSIGEEIDDLGISPRSNNKPFLVLNGGLDSTSGTQFAFDIVTDQNNQQSVETFTSGTVRNRIFKFDATRSGKKDERYYAVFADQNSIGNRQSFVSFVGDTQESVIAQARKAFANNLFLKDKVARKYAESTATISRMDLGRRAFLKFFDGTNTGYNSLKTYLDFYEEARSSIQESTAFGSTARFNEILSVLGKKYPDLRMEEVAAYAGMEEMLHNGGAEYLSSIRNATEQYASQLGKDVDKAIYFKFLTEESQKALEINGQNIGIGSSTKNLRNLRDARRFVLSYNDKDYYISYNNADELRNGVANFFTETGATDEEFFHLLPQDKQPIISDTFQFSSQDSRYKGEEFANEFFRYNTNPASRSHAFDLKDTFEVKSSQSTYDQSSFFIPTSNLDTHIQEVQDGLEFIPTEPLKQKNAVVKIMQGVNMDPKNKQLRSLFESAFGSVGQDTNRPRFNINYEDGISYFILNGDKQSVNQDVRHGVYLIATQDANAQKVKNILSDPAFYDSNELLSLADVRNALDGQASVLEIPRLNKLAVNIAQNNGDPDYMYRIAYGRTSEKAIIPKLSVYTDRDNNIHASFYTPEERIANFPTRYLNGFKTRVREGDYTGANSYLSRMFDKEFGNLKGPEYDAQRLPLYNLQAMHTAYSVDLSGVTNVAHLLLKDNFANSNGAINWTDLNPLQKVAYAYAKHTGIASPRDSITQTIDKVAVAMLDSGEYETSGKRSFKEFLFSRLTNWDIESEDLAMQQLLSGPNSNGIDVSTFKDKNLLMLIKESADQSQIYRSVLHPALSQIPDELFPLVHEAETEHGIYTTKNITDAAGFAGIINPLRPQITSSGNQMYLDPDKINREQLQNVGLLGNAVSFGANPLTEQEYQYFDQRQLKEGTTSTFSMKIRNMSDVEIMDAYNKAAKRINNSGLSQEEKDIQLAVLKEMQNQYGFVVDDRAFLHPALGSQQIFDMKDLISLELSAGEKSRLNEEAIQKNLGDFHYSFDELFDENNNPTGKKILHTNDILAYDENGNAIAYLKSDAAITKEQYEAILRGDKAHIERIGKDEFTDPKLIFGRSEKVTAGSLDIENIQKVAAQISSKNLTEKELTSMISDLYTQVFGKDVAAVTTLATGKHGNALTAKQNFQLLTTRISEYAQNPNVNASDLIQDFVDYMNADSPSLNLQFNETLGVFTYNTSDIDKVLPVLDKATSFIEQNAPNNSMLQGVLNEINYMRENNILYVETQRQVVSQFLGTETGIDNRIRLSYGQYEDGLNFIDTLKQNALSNHRISKDATPIDVGRFSYGKTINRQRLKFNTVLEDDQKNLQALVDAIAFHEDPEKVKNYQIVELTLDEIKREGWPSKVLSVVDGEASTTLSNAVGYNENVLIAKVDLQDEWDSLEDIYVPIIRKNTLNDITERTKLDDAISDLFMDISNISEEEDVQKAITNYYRALNNQTQATNKNSFAYQVLNQKTVIPSSSSFSIQSGTPAIQGADYKRLSALLKERRDAQHIISDLQRDTDFENLDEQILFDAVNKLQSEEEELAASIQQMAEDIDPDKYILKDLDERVWKANLETVVDANGNATRRIGFGVAIGRKGFEALGINFGEMEIRILEDYAKIQELQNSGSLIDLKDANFQVNGLDGFHRFIDNSDPDLTTEFYSRYKATVQKLKDEHIISENIDINDASAIVEEINDHLYIDKGFTITDINTQNAIEARFRNLINIIGDGDTMADLYLREQGTIGYWNRFPVISENPLVKIFYDENIQGKNLRALNPVIDLMLHADHDGDIGFLAAFTSPERGFGALAGASERITQYANVVYDQVVERGEKLFQQMLEEGHGIIPEDLTDTATQISRLLEIGDSAAYNKALEKYVDAYASKKGLDTLAITTLKDNVLAGGKDAESTAVRYAALSSKEMQDVFNNVIGSTVKNSNLLITGRVARSRKDFIGDISKPSLKAKETLHYFAEIAKTSTTMSDETKHLIAKTWSDFGLWSDKNSEGGLFARLEQKIIDPKHAKDGLLPPKFLDYRDNLKKLFSGQFFTDETRTQIDTKKLTKIYRGFITSIGEKEFGIPESEANNYALQLATNTLDDLKTTATRDTGVAKLLPLKQIEQIVVDVPEFSKIYNLFNKENVQEIIAFAKTLSEQEIEDIGKKLNVTALNNLLKKYSTISSPEKLFEEDRVYIASERSTSRTGLYVYDQEKNLFRRLNENNEAEWVGVKPKFLNVDLERSTPSVNFANEFANDINNAQTMLANKRLASQINSTLDALIFSEDKDFKRFRQSIDNIDFGDATGLIKGFKDNKTVYSNNIRVREETSYLIQSLDYLGKDGTNLIRQLNRDIADGNIKLGQSSPLVDYLREAKTRAENNGVTKIQLDNAHRRVVTTSKFVQDIREVDRAFRSLPDEFIDVDNYVSRFEKGFDKIEKDLKGFNTQRLSQSSVSDINNIIGSRNARIDELRNLLEQHNSEVFTIKVLDTLDNNIKGSNRAAALESIFDWKYKDVEQRRIGIGVFTGRRLSDLSAENLKSVQETIANIKANYQSNSMLVELANGTEQAIQGYTATNPDGVKLSTSFGDAILEDSFNDLKKEYQGVRLKLSQQSGPQPGRQKISRTIKESVDGILANKKNLVIGAGVLATMGIVNGLLHRNRDDTPDSPIVSYSGFDDKNDVNVPQQNLPMKSTQSMAPPSPNMGTHYIYHDLPTGLNFKVRAKGGNVRMGAQQYNAALHSAGIDSGTVSLENNMNYVSDNWLQNKFAELSQ